MNTACAASLAEENEARDTGQIFEPDIFVRVQNRSSEFDLLNNTIPLGSANN